MKGYDYEFMVRTAKMDDIDSVQALVTACDMDEFGTTDFAIDMGEVFKSVPIDTNTWVVSLEDGKIVGHAFIEEMGEGRLDTYVFTHPQYKGLGIGTLLVNITEKRAKEYILKYKEKKVSYEFNNIIPAENSAAREILEGRGYKFKRLYSEMSINIINEPDEAVVPDNICIRKYNPSRDARELYDAYCESFQDARSHRPKPFEEWMKDRLREGYDYGLWLLACENEKIIGFITGVNEEKCTWVDLLGVRRNGRRRGIGKALLQSLLKESYRRGVNTVALNVDADSPTNAHKLYFSLGMRPVFQIAMYEKKYE